MHIIGELYDSLKTIVPRNRDDLRNYVKAFLGVNVPDVRICDDHCAPMDYLWHCYTDGKVRGLETADVSVNSDAIVWAGRGGGKTLLGAVATLLDCIFKPDCQVRILAGSGDQAQRMYEYLVQYINAGFSHLLAEPIRKNRCVFINGSGVEVLTQSSACVRGRHVHKLRCDEIELFEPEVFEAAKFITQSKDGIIGGMECLSTMHRPYGLMQKLVDAAEKKSSIINHHSSIYKWCMFESIEKCVDRSCSRCELDKYCMGRAKNAGGYLKIDDCITQMRRSSQAAFESEMLCRRPSLDNAVFAEFEPDIHVAAVEYDANLPLYRAIDFGFVNPFVCLWIQVDGNTVVRVIDEYVRSRTTIDVHARAIIERTPGSVAASFCDPAGAGVNDITGSSPAAVMRSLGVPLRWRASSILQGLELIRRALRRGDGASSLVISPRCGRLIEAMKCYHYPDSAADELPLKDGIYDHPIDALRYFFVNYSQNRKSISKRY